MAVEQRLQVQRLRGQMGALRHLERQLARGDVIRAGSNADQSVAAGQDGSDGLRPGLVIGDLQQGAHRGRVERPARQGSADDER